MDLLSSAISHFNINDAFDSLASIVTEEPLLQTSSFPPPIVNRMNYQRENISPMIHSHPGLHTLSPGDALKRLKNQDQRRRDQRRRMMAAAASSRYSEDKADVVFFPTDSGGGDAGGCQDATTGGGGFNTFGFLAFLLAGFNAVSVVSNNNNNRNNNNNNNNNDNNNNNFQTLESSVNGMQMVQRKKRDVDDDWDSNSVFLEVAEKFMRAWVRNKLTQEKQCQLRNICQANHVQRNSTLSLTFAEVATEGLIRELGLEKNQQQEFIRAGETGRRGENCEQHYNCNQVESNSMLMAEKALFLPSSIFEYLTTK